jgi:nucleoside-diphosphate-sugar epimerase
MHACGGWRWLDHGRALTSSTHIDNLAHAIELALSRGKSGQAYFILDDGARTLREMITGMAASKGISLQQRSIPRRLAECYWATRPGTGWATIL